MMDDPSVSDGILVQPVTSHGSDNSYVIPRHGPLT